MAGLIPLMLGSSSRSSFISPQSLPPRNSSLDATQSAPARIPRSPKRLSFSPPVSVPVPVPQTHAEWKEEIAEIKRLHFGKRWRVCSTKCNKILDNIRDTSSVEPLFLVYLHFYAAISMEICARPLSPSTPFRATLLLQARSHFASAAALVTAAEQSALRRIRPLSVNSWGSSCHSPSESVSSRAWTPDTQVSTPTASVFSFEDAKAQSGPLKRVKKVSFSIPHEQQQPVPVQEPLVRPDSPTLGFDDELFTAASQPDPEMIKPQFQEVELPLHQHMPESIPEESDESSLEDEESYRAARSIDRYCDLLSGFRLQLARHSVYVNDMLSENVVPPPPSRNDDDEARDLDRQARIERLRENGWQRKRFDPTRYEELCETVMAEIS